MLLSDILYPTDIFVFSSHSFALLRDPSQFFARLREPSSAFTTLRTHTADRTNITDHFHHVLPELRNVPDITAFRLDITAPRTVLALPI